MPRFNTLADWLHWQETLHPKKIDLGLERVARVAQRMGVLQPEAVVVTVAGTNGKGSSVAMLEAVLRAAGHRVGSYTSPHLLRYNERIRIDGAEVTDDVLCAAFQAVDEARGEASLSYFEFGTLAALWVLRHAAPEVLLLEVGLGGRLDAVNVVDPDIALVTAIGIDHVQWLGEDREAIGREKAGIFRAGRPAVCSDPAPPAALAQLAGEIGAHWYGLNAQFSRSADSGAWRWDGPAGQLESLPQPALSGNHQLDNAAGVLMVLALLQERFPVSRSAIEAGLQTPGLPARCQVLPGPVERVLDVAHNPHGADSLAGMLRERPCPGRTHLVLGMLEDKDVEGFVDALSCVAERWYLAGLNVERGLSSDGLHKRVAGRVNGPAIQCCRDVETACREAAHHAVAGDRIVVCGSFHTVAAAMKCGV